MKKSFWVFSLILILAVVFVEFDLAWRNARTIAKQVKASPVSVETVAPKLVNADLKKIAEVMSDDKANEDQRTLAVQLVSRHQTVESLKELEKFVLEPVLSSENGKRQLESVLKAQAVEGIAAFPQKDLAISSLTTLDPNISEVFLKDRIKRSMATLQNQVEKSESSPSSEGDALRKLVE